MHKGHTILLVGGTGRTGRRVLRQLLERGVSVRAIVRSVAKVPRDVLGNPALALIEADLLSLGDEALREHVRGCDAVVSCLGHVLNLRGIFGRPRDLVFQTVERVCRAAEALRPAAPVKLIVMSSVSVNRPRRLDATRGFFERAFLWLIRCLLPPARDNQQVADFLAEKIGAQHQFVQWVALRPDTLIEGEVSRYALHEGITDSVFAPATTNMANVAHFMCELATTDDAWTAWRSKLPVITNEPARSAPRGTHG